MELKSIRGEQSWTDFGNEPDEKAVQFMHGVLEQFGFSDMDSMSDDELRNFVHDLEHIEIYEYHQRSKGVDKNNPENYDEYGSLKLKAMSEYGMMIGGMIVYIGNQFHEGGKRYKRSLQH